VALATAALLAVITVSDGHLTETDGQILGTLGALLLAAGAALAGLALHERDGSLLGRVAVVVAPIGFALLLAAIWDSFADPDAWRLGWTGLVLLVALLIAVTARLVARSPGTRSLAMAAGALAGVAATLSTYAFWADERDELVRAVIVLWILAVLAYLLVPVIQRTRVPAVTDAGARVLATLGDVELVATSAGGIDPRLAPGERLLLRRRAHPS